MEKGHSGKLFFLFYRGEVMRRFRGPWISCWPASHAKRHKKIKIIIIIKQNQKIQKL